MHYVYVLKSNKDRKTYVGCTRDLRKRIIMHNTGRVESTAGRRPLKLIFYEAFNNQSDAFEREKYLKTGWGRNQLKKLLFNSLKI
ncbi:MAG: hypothetical protein UT05_C0012G0008 [Parcubacteria group bacterium GW2011_GWF2_38_76]|nr:MAG: hypothetical protein UT05_C0012G0008 [Parcubacteria group bacterium GW2011_GWF2_38_76]HBM46058.1 excinuclease ABC subunit C [Patescibacteria group bacterium]